MFIRHTTLRRAYVHVAKTRWCLYDTCLCRETRWRPYDTQCTFIRHYVSASCIVFTSRNPMSSIRHAVDIYMTYISATCVLCTSQKPDSVHTTLASVAILDGVHTTCKTYLFVSCVLCTSRNQMTFRRHLAVSRYQMACIRH